MSAFAGVPTLLGRDGKLYAPPKARGKESIDDVLARARATKGEPAWMGGRRG